MAKAPELENPLLVGMPVVGDVPAQQEAFQDTFAGMKELINRDEAIDLYFTPDREVDESELIQEQVTMLGDIEVAILRPRSSLPLEQLRRNYKRARIERIGREINECVGGQVQNCNVNVLSEEAAVEKYLADASRYFMRTMTRDDLLYNEMLGGYVVSLSGHNRQFGLAHENKVRHGHPDVGKGMFAQVYRDLSFADALEIQATENSGENLPPWERAKEIYWYHLLKTEEGQMPSLKDMAKIWSIEPEHVSYALRYGRLPAEVQELVECKPQLLDYSTSFKLDRLYTGNPPIMTIKDTVLFVKDCIAQGWGGKKIVSEISSKVDVHGLPDVVKVLINEKGISVEQAKKVPRLIKAGASLWDVDQFLTWVAAHDPDSKEMDKRIASYVRTSNESQLSWTAQEDFLPGGNEAYKRKTATLAKAAIFRASTEEAMSHIQRMQALYRSGLAGGAAASQDIVDAVRELFEPWIGPLTNGELQEVDLTALDELLNALEGAKEQLPINGHARGTKLAQVIGSLTTLVDAVRDADPVQQAILLQERLAEERANSGPKQGDLLWQSESELADLGVEQQSLIA